MATGDGWTSKLLVGLAEHLAANSVGTWRASGAYQPTEVGIYIRTVPPTPDQIITLAPYPVGTTLRGMADHTVAVQIRLRGTDDPRVCDDQADAVFDLLDSCGRQTFNSIPVVDMWRQSYTSLGQDGNSRWERSENYYVKAMRPTSNNTD